MGRGLCTEWRAPQTWRYHHAEAICQVSPSSTVKKRSPADKDASTLEKIGKYGTDIFYSGKLGTWYSRATPVEK